jgi:hypothetical protein
LIPEHFRRNLFIGVPNVGGELPVATDFAPDDGVLPNHFLRRLGFVFRVTVPISRAASGPNGNTSTVVSFASPICCAACRQKASIAARPLTMSDPGGSTKASSVYSAATPAASPLLKAADQASLSFSMVALS